MAGGKAMVMVYDYFGTDRDRSDRVFTITGPGVALRRGPATSVPGASALPGGLLRLDLGGLTGRYEAVLGDLRGRAAVSWTLAGGRSHRLAPGSLPPGLYRLTVRGPGLARTWLLPWSP
jgi:hypothetical protein